jgi:hypothetical protein
MSSHLLCSSAYPLYFPLAAILSSSQSSALSMRHLFPVFVDARAHNGGSSSLDMYIPVDLFVPH